MVKLKSKAKNSLKPVSAVIKLANLIQNFKPPAMDLFVIIPGMRSRWLALQTACLALWLVALSHYQPYFYATRGRSELLSASTRGDVRTIKTILAKGIEPSFATDVDGRTALHLLMEGLHQLISTQPERFTPSYSQAFDILLTTNPRLVSFKCPVSHALHLRLLPLAKQLLDRLTATQRLTCLGEVDSRGDTILHVLTRTKSGGFARLFQRAMTANPFAPALWDMLGVRFDRSALQATFPRIPRRTLDAALGDASLQLLGRYPGLIPGLVNQRNGLGRSGLHLAVLEDRAPSLLSLFLASDADIHQADWFGRTALHLAAARGSDLLVSTLLAHGADATRTDVDNATACQLAQLLRHSGPVLVLTQAGFGATCTSTATPMPALPSCSTGVSVLTVPITPLQFQRDYVALHRPVLLKNFSNWQSSPWRALSAWQPPRLAKLGRYNLTVMVGAIPYAGSYGQRASRMPLSTYAQRYLQPAVTSQSSAPLPYVFDAQTWTSSQVLQRDLPLPVDWIGEATVLEQFIAGPAGTGASPHFHGHAFNCLATGRKLWEVTWPKNAYFEVVPARQYFNQVTYLDQLCVQEAGDAMYVPSNFGHAVFNTNASVGMAFEFVAAFGSLNLPWP
jgi:ankyrin repeat protein